MKVNLIGDVHLGKRFETGVPLHRRGDREQMQFEQFLAELEADCDLNVQVGDLFDKFVVPYTIVWKAAQAYIQAKKRHPDRTYVVLRGNHDASRDADRVSAFQVFTGLVRPHGITVVDTIPYGIGEHLFIPWHPFKTAEEMIKHHVEAEDWKYCYGHWDVVMGDDNRIPAKALLEVGCIKAITGHDHLKRELKIDGLPVQVTGSMQPYSHAEDPEGNLYVTVGLADVLADPDAYVNKCVRLRLAHDEVLDEPIDCLQLQTIRGTDDGEVDLGEVDFEAFDLADLFNQSREQVGLDEDFGNLVLKKLEEARAERG